MPIRHSSCLLDLSIVVSTYHRQNPGNPTDLEAHFVNNDIIKVQYLCY